MSEEPHSFGGGIFISYRRHDEADMTGRIVDRLSRDLPTVSVFFDVESIKPGRDFREAITSYLARSECLVALIGANWQPERLHEALDFVRLELLEARRQDRFIVPVLLKSAPMPRPIELPEDLHWLSFIHAVRIEPDPNFSAQYALLLNTLEAELDPEASKLREAEREIAEAERAKANEQRRQRARSELAAREAAEAERQRTLQRAAEAEAGRQRLLREEAKAKRPAELQAQTRVFVSYRREDSIGMAGRIRDRLASRFGSDNVFFDIDTIPLGVDFRTHIDRTVADCDVVLVVIGRRWVDAVDEQGRRRLDQPGDYVRLEVEAALRRDIRVVPLLVDGATIPRPHQLPASLTDLAFRNGTPVRYDPDFHPDVDRLLRDLVPSSPPSPGPHTVGDRAERKEPPVTIRPSHPVPPRPTRSTLEGHTDRVLGCAVATDGTWIVSASADHTLRIWDAATGSERRVLKGHTGPVCGCAVAPDGTWIVSASADHTLRIWDAATGTKRRILKGHTDRVGGCAVAPDGNWIVSASNDETLRIWDVTTGAERHILEGHTGSVEGCAVAPDGTWIASASWDRTLRIWDAATGTEGHILKGHTGPVDGCAVAPDGTWIASASWDKTLRVWDAATGTKRHILKGHTGYVSGCAVAPDGTWIASASWDKTLRIWDAATGTKRHILKGHTGSVWGCAVAPYGTWIVSASNDNKLRIWDAAGGRPVGTG